MTAPLTGKEVAGYRTLSEDDIAGMNRLKAASKLFLDTLANHPNVDPRWAAIARTDMQTACMAACRAVAKPSEES